MNSVFILFSVVSGSHLLRCKLNKNTQSEHVEIKELSKPPSSHFYWAHLGAITYLQCGPHTFTDGVLRNLCLRLRKRFVDGYSVRAWPPLQHLPLKHQEFMYREGNSDPAVRASPLAWVRCR